MASLSLGEKDGEKSRVPRISLDEPREGEGKGSGERKKKKGKQNMAGKEGCGPRAVLVSEMLPLITRKKKKKDGGG